MGPDKDQSRRESQDSLNKLMDLIGQASEGGTPPDPQEVMQQSFSMFQSLMKEMQNADFSQMGDFLTRVQDIYGQINGKVKDICQKLGISEDEFRNLMQSQGAERFSGDQQKFMQMMEEQFKGVQGSPSLKKFQPVDIEKPQHGQGPQKPKPQGPTGPGGVPFGYIKP